MRRTWTVPVLALLVGLIAGAAIGWALGRLVWPVRYVDVEVSDLSLSHQDEFVVMVGAAFEQSGDLSSAESALSLLGTSDPVEYVRALADRLAAAGDEPSSGLVLGLAQALAPR